ncbi:MAG: hypothetical protein QOJ83_1399 [Frankiales bacterium]|nr:hypothetical protein [Frankiales bacterium]
MSTALLERPGVEAIRPVPAPRARESRAALSGRGWLTWPLALGVGMAAGALWWAIGNAGAVRRSAVVLVGLQPGWLLVAAVAAAATWVCSGLSQQGAVASSLPLGRLVAAQFAGTFANQFTPAGLGGGAVNVRFLRRNGSTTSEAVAAVGLTQLAGVAVHMSLLAAVLVAGPSLPTSAGHLPGWLIPVLAVAAAAALVIGVLARSWIVSRVLGLWSHTVSALSHLRSPRRMAELVLGSVGLTVAHIAVLYLILRALDVHPSVLAVAAAYLLATTVGVLVPTPGSVGGLDAVLGVLLYESGISSPTAVAAVLAYRLLTSWLALLPSALTLNTLVRRGIL